MLAMMVGTNISDEQLASIADRALAEGIVSSLILCPLSSSSSSYALVLLLLLRTSVRVRAPLMHAARSCPRVLAADRDGDQLISFDEFAAALERSDVEQKMSIRFLNWSLRSGTQILFVHARTRCVTVFLTQFSAHSSFNVSIVSSLHLHLLPFFVFVFINRNKLCFRVLQLSYKTSPSLRTIRHINKFHCHIWALTTCCKYSTWIRVFLRMDMLGSLDRCLIVINQDHWRQFVIPTNEYISSRTTLVDLCSAISYS